MSTHEDANLILKLYELRREPKMREARDWFFMQFHPDSIEDFKATMMSEHSGHMRMVLSYWEMATALVNHGSIDADLFADTNGEYIGVFAKVQHLLPQIREFFGTEKAFQNIEKFVQSRADGQENVDRMRERMKGWRAMMEQQMAAKAKAAEN